MHWPDPVLAWQPGLDEGPVLVTVEYCVEPPQAGGFLNAMCELERRRRRDGVIQCVLFHDAAQPSRYVEPSSSSLGLKSSVATSTSQLDFQAGRTPPIVTHLVAEHLMRERRHNHAAKATGLS
jgi:hypothetical protein